MTFTTEQEEFWAGTFGRDYIDRNNTQQAVSGKIALWSTMLKRTQRIRSIKELGCNIGLNLLALNRLHPDLQLSGVEINETAAKHASDLNVAKITCGTILEKMTDAPVDLTFTAGVLIHIDPDHLTAVYDNLVSQSSRYVLVAEYYNPVPVAIDYRGHQGKLFKRDFAGDLIDQYGLKLIDYGFVYKRDTWAPQDDITWFLMEK